VGNVDSTIIAEEPRLGDHILAIQARIALTMGIAKELVSVKATSPEGMGALGRSEGIAVQAVAQIVSQHDC
jgi:2-C-methyl-D-erythritol 2,4-cyclodiphosphate synthase